MIFSHCGNHVNYYIIVFRTFFSWLKLGFNLELDYEFIVKFMMKMKENRRLFSLNQAFEETAKVFKMTPEEAERKYVELKDLI